MARHARTIARARRGGRAARTALRPELVEDAVPAHPAANRVVWLQVVHDAAVCAFFFRVCVVSEEQGPARGRKRKAREMQ